MKIEEIKAKLAKSWKNGAYIERPHFRCYERVYITKNGSFFHETEFRDGKVTVVPTVLEEFEAIADDWYFNDFSSNPPSKDL